MKSKYLITTLVIILVIVLSDSIRLRILKNKMEYELNRKEYLFDLMDSSIQKIKETDSIEIAKYDIRIKEISPRYESSISRLKRKGLSAPLKIIRDDLMRNHDLIPNRDMPKGKVYFQRNHINIINSNWVIAYYEDGHFDGELLLRMDIDANGNILWTVLDDNR